MAARSQSLRGFSFCQSLRILLEEAAIQRRAVDSAERSLEQAPLRSRRGLVRYLEVTSAQRVALQNEPAEGRTADMADDVHRAVDEGARWRLEPIRVAAKSIGKEPGREKSRGKGRRGKTQEKGAPGRKTCRSRIEDLQDLAYVSLTPTRHPSDAM